MKTMMGVIKGTTIELAHNPGLPEGEQVEVIVRVARKSMRSGEGLRRCAGALASDWTEEDDRILEEIEQDRRRASFRELPE